MFNCNRGSRDDSTGNVGGRGDYPPLYSEKKMRVDHEIKISWSKCGSVVLVLSKISNFKKKI